MKYHYRIKHLHTKEIKLGTSKHTEIELADGYENAHSKGKELIILMGLCENSHYIEVFPAVGHVAYIHHHPYMEHDYRNDEEYRERNDGYYHQ